MEEPKKKHKVSTKRKVFRIAIVTTFIYCSVGIALYHLQEWFLFEPVRLPEDYKFKFNVPFEEINIAMNKTDTLNLIRFYPADSIPKGIVIYFHGNTENVNHYARYASNFTKHGYEVLMPDYPTYGKSSGELTEDNIYRQAKEVYKLAHSKFPATKIIVYGMSLGTGVASYIAAKEECAQLILEAPYCSIPDLFNSYTPFYPTHRMARFKFPVSDYLKEIEEPITIFHGTSDKMIPYRCAAKLKKVLKPTDEFITIDNGAHNNLNDFPLFREKLDSILK